MSRFEVGHIYIVTDGKRRLMRSPKGLIQMKVMTRSGDRLGVVLMYEGARSACDQPLMKVTNVVEVDGHERLTILPDTYSDSDDMVM